MAEFQISAPPRPAPYKPILSIAPMMDWTDRHYRFFMRQLSKRTLLYTEMVTTGAILHGDRERLLAYSDLERPLALQLGGDQPKALARCASIAASWGYDEVNLNVGCPSERVQNGRFGACLMAHPEAVAEAAAAMRAAVDIPVTVKHRIGIDDLDSYEHMANFVRVVAASGVARFSVHARKAWLKGLSPKENRSIPPLRYEDVYRLKREFPQLHIDINGGVRDFAAARRHLEHVDGVMIGRAAYEDPYMFADADGLFYDDLAATPSRREVIEGMIPYVAAWLERGLYLRHIARHMLGLFNGQPGAKAWRRHLSEHMHRPDSSVHTLEDAMRKVPAEVLDARATLVPAG